VANRSYQGGSRRERLKKIHVVSAEFPISSQGFPITDLLHTPSSSLLGWKTIHTRNSGRTLSLNPRPILDIKKEVRSLATNCWTSLHDSDEVGVDHILCDLDIDPALLLALAMTPISHLEGTSGTRHDLYVLKVREMITGNGLEASLAV
jgi:hypothetical protein